MNQEQIIYGKRSRGQQHYLSRGARLQRGLNSIGCILRAITVRRGADVSEYCGPIQNSADGHQAWIPFRGPVQGQNGPAKIVRGNNPGGHKSDQGEQ